MRNVLKTIALIAPLLFIPAMTTAPAMAGGYDDDDDDDDRIGVGYGGYFAGVGPNGPYAGYRPRYDRYDYRVRHDHFVYRQHRHHRHGYYPRRRYGCGYDGCGYNNGYRNGYRRYRDYD